MADAPTPRYDSQGNLVASWSVRVDYDPQRDTVSVSWHQGAGSYHPSKSGQNLYTPVDIEDAAADVQRRLRILGARRLL